MLMFKNVFACCLLHILTVQQIHVAISDHVKYHARAPEISKHIKG